MTPPETTSNLAAVLNSKSTDEAAHALPANITAKLDAAAARDENDAAAPMRLGDNTVKRDAALLSTDNAAYCVECEDQPSSLFCQQCADDYCDVCFQSLHRKGQRREHQVRRSQLHKQVRDEHYGGAESAAAGADMQLDGAGDTLMTAASLLTVGVADGEYTEANSGTMALRKAGSGTLITGDDTFRERARWIPVRLNLKGINDSRGVEEFCVAAALKHTRLHPHHRTKGASLAGGSTECERIHGQH